PDSVVPRPAAASLSGSVRDDGLPTPPGAVTAAWRKISGPGDVTFAAAASASTTATFLLPGDYVLRLTADDGALVHWDDVAVVVREADGTGVLDVPVRTGADDAEERSDRTILTGADLELVQDGTAVQKVGLRFAGVALPQGAVIRKAHVQFTNDEPQTAPVTLSVAGHATDDAPAFTTASKDVSGRTRTVAAVAWSPASWPTVGARDVDQRTPDLAAVLQEIVDRPGWTEGNALSLIVTGTGTRTAAAYERGTGKAPVLHVEYGPAPGKEPVNAAPVADAGADLALTLPAGATLTGSLRDDGLPVGAPVTAAWTTVSGPGAVTFATPTATSTGVTFGAAGTYVLRFTGSDGQLTGSDDVTVTVSPAPVPSGVLDVRPTAGADDAEERSDGRVTTKNGALTLGRDGSRAQTVGLRFAGIQVPAGARITKAYVQFQADATNAQSTRLTIVGQAADDPAGFTTAKRNISARPTTAARVSWLPAGWSAGMRSAAQRTPDLAAVVQEIVSRPGWAKGNAVVLLVSGNGTRVAEAVEAGAAKAPVLHVEFGPAPTGG
ncbi:MAG: PKD domain-containing protein, partial [Actinomycetes bacterium]